MERCLKSRWPFSPHYFNWKPVPMLNCPKHEEAACNVQPKFIHHPLVITSFCAKIVLLF